MPRVVGPIRRARPVEIRDVEFLRSITDRRIKITVPGPFTMIQQAQNDDYPDDRSLALAYAEGLNEELRDLKAAGADVVQITFSVRSSIVRSLWLSVAVTNNKPNSGTARTAVRSRSRNGFHNVSRLRVEDDHEAAAQVRDVEPVP